MTDFDGCRTLFEIGRPVNNNKYRHETRSVNVYLIIYNFLISVKSDTVYLSEEFRAIRI